MIWKIHTKTLSLRTLKIMPRNLSDIVCSWIRLQVAESGGARPPPPTPFNSFYPLNTSYTPAIPTRPQQKQREIATCTIPYRPSPLLSVCIKSNCTLYVSRWKVAAAFCKLHIFLYALCIALSPHSAGNSLKAFISYRLLINSRTSNISVYRGKNRNCPEEYYTVENQKLNLWTYNFVEVSGHNLEISQT